MHAHCMTPSHPVNNKEPFHNKVPDYRLVFGFKEVGRHGGHVGQRDEGGVQVAMVVLQV